MSAFIYGLQLQWRLDIRNKAMLITCYLLPLIFFVFMGGVFTSINPESRNTIIQSMSIFGVSMGALVGLPPSLIEIYNSDIKKVYKANGVPLFLGVATHFISAFIHLLIMCIIIYFSAPLIFEASMPSNTPVYFISLAVFIATTLSIGCIFGLVMKNLSSLTVISQLVFMPSIMLSGIMFPTSMLPAPLTYVAMIFPATWANKAMTEDVTRIIFYIPMLLVFIVSMIVCSVILNKKIGE